MKETNLLPLVSIVLATYNGEKYLKQQLDSLFAQTYPNIELIAVDDASSDNTLNILNEYSSSHTNMKVFSNETNLGFIKNFEKACRLSTGEFVSPCDQDDVWHLDKVKLMVEQIGDCPLIYCDSYVCSENLEVCEKKISELVNCRSWNNCLQYAVFARIYGHALLFRRSLLNKIIPFTELVPHDWWIAYNALIEGGIKYLDEPLIYYRQHDMNAFGVIGRKEKPKTYVKTNDKKNNWLKKRNRVNLFYTICPDQFKKEKEILYNLKEAYKDFSLKNNLKRMLLFFKYKDFFLAPKKYSRLHKNLFCIKMFFKIS